METNLTTVVESTRRLKSAADAFPLALTGMLVVFSALALISGFIYLLPRILAKLAPYLPPEQGDLVPSPAHGSAASALAIRPPDAFPDAFADERPPPEMAAAIAAAIHQERK